MAFILSPIFKTFCFSQNHKTTYGRWLFSYSSIYSFLFFFTSIWEFCEYLGYKTIMHVMVQDCLPLLNNLLWTNASNQVCSLCCVIFYAWDSLMLLMLPSVVQILLRETMGFDPVISILKLRGSTYSFTQQKVRYWNVYKILPEIFEFSVTEALLVFLLFLETNAMPVDN